MLKSHWNPKLQTARPRKARKERMPRSKKAKRRRGRTSDRGSALKSMLIERDERGCLSNHNFNSRSYCQLTNWAHVYIYICKIYICGLALTNKSNRELKLGFGALSIFFWICLRFLEPQSHQRLWVTLEWTKMYSASYATFRYSGLL